MICGKHLDETPNRIRQHAGLSLIQTKPLIRQDSLYPESTARNHNKRHVLMSHDTPSLSDITEKIYLRFYKLAKEFLFSTAINANSVDYHTSL